MKALKIRKFAGYADKDGNPSIFTEDLPVQELIDKGMFLPEELPVSKIFECETELWQQACKLWHEFNDWDPYVPMMSEQEERKLHKQMFK